ncbi:MAG: ROK family protein [Solirubrobacteraceae bacterium]
MSTVVGIDLGGTKVATAVMRRRSVAQAHVTPTVRSGAGALIDQLVECVTNLGESEIEAVGIGVPSVVEFGTGRVISSVNVPLESVPLRQVLGDRLGVPVFVDNDATVAALAEAHDEQLCLTAHNLVMLTIGTGVGGGIVLGGRIYRGASGAAGELGHTLVGLRLDHDVAAAGDFPQPASLEHVASGHALDRLARQCAQEHPGSSLARRLANGEPVLGADAVRAAHEGDEPAAHVVRIWARRVGVGVANAINTFDPEEVVIGGGAAQAGDLLLGPVREVAGEYVLPGLGTRTTMRLARHGVRAGVIGAALLAEHELEILHHRSPAPQEEMSR